MRSLIYKSRPFFTGRDLVNVRDKLFSYNCMQRQMAKSLLVCTNSLLYDIYVTRDGIISLVYEPFSLWWKRKKVTSKGRLDLPTLQANKWGIFLLQKKGRNLLSYLLAIVIRLEGNYINELVSFSWNQKWTAKLYS